MADVTHVPDRSRFESGKAYLTYEESDGRFDLQHTVVPEEMAGEGVGGALVKAAVAYAREAGLELVVTCPFAQSWLDKHPVG
ncbi:MAG: N-acetyltransferase [Frankiaceae bacterium]|nr:N-acetyltransferase [Frankiaceae bacterium]